jgi:cob(I)alamin adenosyltransferase
LVALARRSRQPISPDLLAYVNRLSDLLFVLARAANAAAGEPELMWTARS